MYEYSKVINGISRYVDEEIINKIVGWRKWVVGSGAGLMLSNAAAVFNKLKNNEFVKMLDVIDNEDRVNIEKIYVELKKQAQKSAITFDFPALGPITLNENDVERLYELIKSS